MQATCSLKKKLEEKTVKKKKKKEKQETPNTPLTEEWMELWYVLICTRGHYSATKRSPAVCNNVDGPQGHYGRGPTSDRERRMLYDPTYMWNLKTNQPKSPTHRKRDHVCAYRLEMGGRDGGAGSWRKVVRGTNSQFRDEGATHGVRTTAIAAI